MSQEVLIVDNVTKLFGQFAAVDGMNMRMNEGGVYLLVGPNGCGKSTLVNCISGFYKPNDGNVYYRSADITGEPMYKIAQRGLVRTFQIASPFLRLTTLENMLAAIPDNAGESIVLSLFRPTWEGSEVTAVKRASELLRVLGLRHVWNMPANTLSGGELKLLEIGRALMCGAETILLDEPTAGLMPKLVTDVLKKLEEMAETTGLPVVVVEQRARRALEIGDYAYMMRGGAFTFEGQAEELLNHPQLTEMYLGAVEVHDLKTIRE